jgi:hypothetical protein
VGAAVERQRAALGRPPHEPAARAHELDVSLRAAERLRREVGRAVAAAPERGDAVGALVQRGVHLVAQLVAHAEVDGDRDDDHGDRHRHRGGGRDPGAQAHGSRST